jgi:hypothetical protein
MYRIRKLAEDRIIGEFAAKNLRAAKRFVIERFHLEDSEFYVLEWEQESIWHSRWLRIRSQARGKDDAR